MAKEDEKSLRQERERLQDQMKIAIASSDMPLYHKLNRAYQKIDKKIRSKRDEH